MKAAFFEKAGGLEVIKYSELPTPKPQQGEALIRVRACGLNHLDIWLRRGRLGMTYPHIPGCDVSGTIQEINGESALKVGQDVVLNPAIPCGECIRCKQGSVCELVRIFGAKTQGGYAEYVVVPIGQLYTKPKDISFVEAAAFPLTFLTAWHMLVSRAALQKSETVFVWGASGGLGSAAVQIAKYLGARVIAAARSEEMIGRVKEIGADEVIVYTNVDVAREVKRLTDGRGVDVVFESVGEKTWSATLAILRPFGRVVIAGTTSGDIVTQNLSDIYVRQLTILGARMGTKDEFEEVLPLVERGILKPIIDVTFPLSDAIEAQKRMEEGKHFGKIVLEVL